MRVNQCILRFAERTIILVEFDNGETQPMYRSTGINSGMPGTWLPFDCITNGGTWFDKSRYVGITNPDVPPHLERFGTPELKKLSEELGELGISLGVYTAWEDINDFLSGQRI